jgi:aspartyl-tRNA(Asn)/glutamyl-tRNA(Gln) amidotransferase subunit C
MKADRILIRQVAALSKLRLSEQEFGDLSANIQNILEYVQVISDFNLESTDVDSTSVAARCPFREDLLLQGLDSKQVFLNVPDSLDNLVRVPIIIE